MLMYPMSWLKALMLPCLEKSEVTAKALCMLCEHYAYCISRLNMNMYLLISPAQK